MALFRYGKLAFSFIQQTHRQISSSSVVCIKQSKLIVISVHYIKSGSKARQRLGRRLFFQTITLKETFKTSE